MNQDNERKIKAQTMGSIMRHPKLSRTFSDAVSSPIGSTKRKQAQSMLGVMNKVNQRILPAQQPTGIGGPGFIGPMQQTTTSTPQFSTPPANKLLFSAAPLPASTISQYRAPTPNDYSGLGSVVSEIPSAAKSIFGSMMKAPAAAGRVAANLPGGLMALPLMSAAVVESGVKSAPKLWSGWNEGELTSPTETNAWRGVEALTTKAPWRTAPQQMQNTGAQTMADTSGEQAPMQGPQPQGTQTTSSMANAQIPGGESIQPPGVTTPAQQGGSSASAYSQPQLSTPSSSGAQPASSSGFSSVQDAVNKNIGPAAFAYNAMGDKELLKRLFPGMPEDQLPMGASLSQQIGDLHDIVRKDLSMDMIENSLSNKIKTGTNLTNDLNAYIKGRDEVVGSLDNMISDFQTKMIGDGQSLRDPETVNTIKNYGNYLYTLKGRAAQRYVDFANQSITQFGSELKGLESLYEQKTKEFETIYNQRATMTQEDYNRTYSMLTDLYNNIEQAPAKAMNMATMKAQLDAANATIAAAATPAGSGVFGDYSGDDYIKGAKFYQEIMLDKEGNLRKGGTIDDYIAQASRANIPVNAAIDTFVNGVVEDLEKNASNPTAFNESLKYAQNVLSGDVLSAIASQYPDSSAGGAYAAIIPKINNSISKHVLSNIEPYKAALKDIAPGNWIGSGRTIKDKNKWMSAHPDVPADSLSLMYDTLMGYASAGSPNGKPSASSPAILGIYDTVLNLDDNKISNYIAKFLSPLGQ